jgi:restriction endonuclease Mrr
LRNALLANPALIDAVSTKKTEQLVGSVFADFFNCDARVVGRSGDGGIDLVLVLADSEIAVQVKHRDQGSHHWRAEPVATVREFLGATILSGHRRAVFVTTAQRFSRGAEEAAVRAVTTGHVTQYELFDASALFDALRLTSSCIHAHWEDNFPSVITAQV